MAENQDPRPAAAPAEDEALRETIARAICDVWEYLWDGDPDEDDQVAPEVTVGYDTRPSKELYREAANTILPIIHAREADTARQIAEAHEEIASLAKYAKSLQIALTGLAGGGSENFIKHGNDFRADIPFCIDKVHQRFQSCMDVIKDHVRKTKDVEAQCIAMKGERDAAREALRPFVFGDPVMEDILWGRFPDDKSGTITTNLGAFRRARAVLAASGDGGKRAE